MTSTEGHIARKPHQFGHLPALALVGLIVLGLMSAPGAVRADSKDQHRAQKALKAGQIVPLRKMLGSVEDRYEGDVLEVELDDERVNGVKIWIYEIKLLTPQGNVLKMDIDAKTMEILLIKGRGAEKARRK